MQTQEFISIKDACQILGCGRTKIYTYYIKEGLLTIKMKRGNRSFFLKSDVLEVFHDENTPRDYILTTPKQAPLSQMLNNPMKNQKHVAQHHLKSNSLHPEEIDHTPKAISEGQVLKSDSSDELLARINELENQLQMREQQILEFKKQLHNTVPLVEYHKELEESQKLIEETREQLKLKDESLISATKQTEQLAADKAQLNEQFGQSLRLAVQLKKQLDREHSRKEQLRKLQIRWKELQGQLAQCGYFCISRRFQIHRELKQIQDAITKFR